MSLRIKYSKRDLFCNVN